MFTCVISNKDVYSQFVFDVLGPTKHMHLWIKFPIQVLIADEVSHWGL